MGRLPWSSSRQAGSAAATTRTRSWPRCRRGSGAGASRRSRSRRSPPPCRSGSCSTLAGRRTRRSRGTPRRTMGSATGWTWAPPDPYWWPKPSAATTTPRPRSTSATWSRTTSRSYTALCLTTRASRGPAASRSTGVPTSQQGGCAWARTETQLCRSGRSWPSTSRRTGRPTATRWCTCGSSPGGRTRSEPTWRTWATPWSPTGPTLRTRPRSGATTSSASASSSTSSASPSSTCRATQPRCLAPCRWTPSSGTASSSSGWWAAWLSTAAPPLASAAWGPALGRRGASGPQPPRAKRRPLGPRSCRRASASRR
mmetsp:Transcript_18668/g.52747  ORF Transcript_18668/g.52747 Transcript_18668/m.52747 type:complete len:313 (+) Transcript_18668:1126-2064(+)